MSHEAGATVVVQEIWKDAVWAARPMTVVQDEDDLVALWFPQGTRWKAPTSPPGWLREEERGERMVTCLERREWVFADSQWDVSTLVLMRPGDWHAVWVSWLDGNQHWGWYVNLQEPFRRTDKGYETMDLALDVIIELDRTWRWKDEGELDLFVERGVFGEELATRVRDEGLRVAQRAERNEWPFDAPWPDWRPDRSWRLPQLPEGWSERCR